MRPSPAGPFALRESRAAGFLESAGEAERLARSVAGRLIRGDLPFRLAELRSAREPRSAATSPAAADGRKTCLVYLPAVAWSYRFQRPQQLALALARSSGGTVLYVEGFSRSWIQPRWRQRAGGPGVVRLRMRVPGRPDPYRHPLSDRAARSLADLLESGLASRVSAIVAQLPFWAPLASQLRNRLGVPLVYDRLDLHGAFPGIPETISTDEEDLLRSADLVTASSSLLAEGARRLNRNVALLPNAVALEDFSLPLDPPTQPRTTGAPVRAGYVGALGPWFDDEAIAATATGHPEWELCLAGRVEAAAVARLARLPNVRLIGEIPYSAVPEFLRTLDVALVPFRDTDLTRSVDPVKLYEAFAVGLPVVSRDLPEVRRWKEPLLFTYRHPGELAASIARAVAGDTSEVRRTRRTHVADHTWDRRAADLLVALASTIRHP